MSLGGRAVVGLLLGAALGAAGLHHVPPPTEAFLVAQPAVGSGPGRLLEPGLTWRVPLLTRIARYEAHPFQTAVAFRREEDLGLASREGASLRFSATLELEPDLERILILHRALGAAYRDGASIRQALAESLRSLCAGLPYGEILTMSGEARRAVAGALAAGASGAGLRLRRVLTAETWPEIYPEGTAGAQPEDRRILLVGMDGADWSVIDPILEAGRMPVLGRLLGAGSRARLKALTPTLSPILWTSIATGKGPDKHGIVDFLAFDARTGASIPVTSTMRKARAFWEILSNRGVTVGTVGWWATWPAEPVLGFQVSDRVAYQLRAVAGEGGAGEGLRGRTWPEALMAALAPDIAAAGELAARDAARILGRPPRPEVEDEQNLLGILTSTRTYHGAALRLLREYRPRVAAVYYEGTDTVAHLFMRYAPPRMPGVSEEDAARLGHVLERYYEIQDALLGELLGAAGPGTTVLVVSDHGFKSGAARPMTDPRIGVGGAADWHRKFGILAASGPGIRAGIRLPDASILDVTPTLLALLGLPRGKDMDGVVVRGLLEGARAEEEIATYETEEAGRRGEATADARDPAAREVEREMIAKLTALGYLGQTGPNADNNAGIQFLQHGRHEEAAAAFRRAIAEEPAFQGARVNLGRALMAGGDFRGALRELEAVRRDAPDAPDVENLIGNIRMEQGDLEAAERTFRSALERDPSNPHLVNSLGIVLDRQGRAEEALAAFRRVTEIDPDYAEAINNAGLILRARGRLPDAVLEFERAIRADADFPGSYNNLGLTHQDAGDFQAALAAYEEGLRIDPENAVILNNKGSVLLALGRPADARAAFEQAVAADPDYPSAHNNLGAVLGILGYPAAELEEYLRAIELDPDYADARFNLGLNLMKEGKASSAEKTFRETLRISPDHPRAHLELGVLLAGRGSTHEAASHLARAGALAPRWAAPRSALARLYAGAGRRAEALGEARASLAIDPNQPEIARLVESLTSTSGSKP